MFVIICDSKAKFGGWDEHGEQLANTGSLELDLHGMRAFVEEGNGGHLDVYEGHAGEIWLNNPGEDVGVADPEKLKGPRIETIWMGTVDVPSAVLTIALAYPALNVEADGDHVGVPHEDGERLDIKVEASVFDVVREFVECGNFVALKPRATIPKH